MTKFFSCIVFLFIGLFAVGQNDTAEIFIISGAKMDIISDVIVTYENSYKLIGTKTDRNNSSIYVVDIDTNFSIIKSNLIGTQEIESPNCIIQLKDSSFLIGGRHNGWGSGGYDGYLLKIDKNNRILWEKSIGTEGWDNLYSIVKSDNKLFVGLNEFPSFGGALFKILEINPVNGNIIKEIKLTSKYSLDEFKKIEIVNNHFFVFGTSEKNSFEGSQIVIQKVSLNGGVIKEVAIGEEGDEIFNNIYVDSEKYLLIAGSTNSKNLAIEGREDFYFVKIDTNLNILFEKTYGSPTSDLLYGISENSNKDYIVSGSSSDGSFGLGGWGHRIIQTDNDLNFKLGPTFGDEKDEKAIKALKGLDKGFAFFGTTTSYSAQYEDIYIIKINDENIVNDYFLKIKIIEDNNPTIISSTNNSFNKNNNFDVFIENNSITLKNPLNKELNYLLINSFGQLIIKDRTNLDIKSVNLQDLNTGVYSIIIYHEHEVFTKKIMLNK